jgi:hypothetical protein
MPVARRTDPEEEWLDEENGVLYVEVGLAVAEQLGVRAIPIAPMTLGSGINQTIRCW